MTANDDFPQLSPELYQAFCTAVEIGKWPDGRTLTPEQRETCMAAIIRYDLVNNAEQDRVGFIDKGHKSDGDLCDDQTQVLSFKGESK